MHARTPPVPAPVLTAPANAGAAEFQLTHLRIPAHWTINRCFVNSQSEGRQVQWTAFTFGGECYDLRHLHPRTCRYEQPAKGDRPARTYTVDVIFSLHCFTRAALDEEEVDTALLYSDDREMRVFDFQRYELSKQLPAIIESLGSRRCFQTGHDNFFSVAIVDRDGNNVEYDIFFTASRASRKRGVVNLYVQSAYVRDKQHGNRPRMKSPIGFYVILFNVQNGRPIRPSPN